MGGNIDMYLGSFLMTGPWLSRGDKRDSTGLPEEACWLWTTWPQLTCNLIAERVTPAPDAKKCARSKG
jgi:hypothetical protein